ncbi:Esterase SGNH hydrolase-type [Penicillium soppii]|uniref:Esterase SGNH hydrolase-type n=1 Tax=Penicillium soppii TaxID=69789 RepID=UPI002547CA12|nr:Esterase SGNH hydrolase-type [Penicillium soppii]KAJ5876513.1 Esterase SGNH hydrolase-type [Penicillium soppii]
MRHKLSTLYKSILEKAETTDFNLFVTGYVGFFNQDTTDCDQSSYDYFKSGYKPSGNLVMLTRDLRTELNLLVAQLNNAIESAVQDANAGAKTTQIHYVDVLYVF